MSILINFDYLSTTLAVHMSTKDRIAPRNDVAISADSCKSKMCGLIQNCHINLSKRNNISISLTKCYLLGEIGRVSSRWNLIRNNAFHLFFTESSAVLHDFFNSNQELNFWRTWNTLHKQNTGCCSRCFLVGLNFCLSSKKRGEKHTNFIVL